MEIHQLLVSAVPGDAITSAALELQALLARVGPSRIYARYVHPDLEDAVQLVEKMAERRSPSLEDDVIIFHASIGEPVLFSFLMDRPERLVVDYHNISPPEPFYPYDPAFAGLLHGGRREVAALAGRATAALADSEFNAGELRAMGYPQVHVAPLVVDPGRLAALAEPDATGEPGESVVLFVGQLLPHKRPDFLLQAFHFLATYLDRRASLVLVGPQRLTRYADAVRREAAELNLERLVLAGPVTDGELAGWYRRASVFVTASEHEGFCVPLVEAMAFGVPIVARRFTAVPETLGGAGLLLEADDGPAVAAEALARVLSDPALHGRLARRGAARLAAFDPDRARARLLDRLLEVVAA